MTRIPIGKVKNVAQEALRLPAFVVGSVIGVAKGVIAGTGSGTGSGTGDEQLAKEKPTQEPPSPPSPISTTDPVNVTEELGLDPAPVAKPQPKAKAPARKPTTSIDAAADPSQVEATPADIADVVSQDDAGEEPAGSAP